MPFTADRVKMTTATTGTGTITLGSAVSGFRTFATAGITTGTVVPYTIEDGQNWECGQGVYNASVSTLTRSAVSSSSSSNAAISLSGSATVYISLLAGVASDGVGSPSLTDWRNSLVEMAKSRSYIPMIGAAADGFFDQTGIDVANSVNATYDSTNKLYYNTDPYTKLLMHFDGANGSTTFTDQQGHTINATGSPTISTVQSVFGGASLRLPGSAYLTSPASADFGIGTGDFSVKFRWRPDSIGTAYCLFDTRTSSGSSVPGFCVLMDANGHLQLYDGPAGGFVFTGTTVMAAATWYALQVSRKGGTYYFLINGNVEGSTANTSNHGASQPVTIGANGGGTGIATGCIDELQFSVGIARNTTAYTPETAAFSAAPALDLRSTTFSAGFTPVKGSLFFVLNVLSGGPIAVGTNFMASLAQDGSTSGASIPLTLSGTTLTGYPIYEANGVALGGTGTQPKWRLQTTGTLQLQVRGNYWQVK